VYYLTLLRNLILAHPYEALVCLWILANVAWAQLPRPTNPTLLRLWTAVHAILGLAVTHSKEEGTFTMPSILRAFVEGMLEICGRRAVQLSDEEQVTEPRRSLGGPPAVPSVRPEAAVGREPELTPVQVPHVVTEVAGGADPPGVPVPFVAAPQAPRGPDSGAFGPDVLPVPAVVPVKGKEN
jgi:hypothetical protein